MLSAGGARGSVLEEQGGSVVVMQAKKFNTVLFLCTGNFYRSRFAEIYFNWLAPRESLAWRADSRGLALDPANFGPLSTHTRLELQTLGIPLPDPLRDPLDAAVADFEAARLIVALKEAEHRCLMQSRFPSWADRIEYWHVHDLDCAGPAEALPQVKRHVEELVLRLKQSAQVPPLHKGGAGGGGRTEISNFGFRISE